MQVVENKQFTGANKYHIFVDMSSGNEGFANELQEECHNDPDFAKHVAKHHKGNSVGLVAFDSRRWSPSRLPVL